MANYIAIDGGTTNTRVYLVINGRISHFEKINIGAKKSIGGNAELKNAIKDAIGKLLEGEGLCTGDIECIIASGMITSEYGLFKLDHLVAPAGLNELSKGMTRAEIEDVCDLPFYFIPGVKLAGGTLEGSDINSPSTRFPTPWIRSNGSPETIHARVCVISILNISACAGAYSVPYANP